MIYRRQRLIASLTLRDLFKRYRKYYKKDATSKQVYDKVMELFHKKLMEKVIAESEEVNLPLLGSLRIKKKQQYIDIDDPSRYVSIDWKATKECGKRVLHLNEDRNGYYYRFLWNKDTQKIRNKSIYKFVTTRNNKRTLAKTLKTNAKIDYYV